MRTTIKITESESMLWQEDQVATVDVTFEGMKDPKDYKASQVCLGGLNKTTEEMSVLRASSDFSQVPNVGAGITPHPKPQHITAETITVTSKDELMEYLFGFADDLPDFKLATIKIQAGIVELAEGAKWVDE